MFFLPCLDACRKKTLLMTGILRHLDGWVAAARGGEMVATDRIAAAADEIDPSYSPSGANVYRI